MKHHLLQLLVCPRTGSGLRYHDFNGDSALISTLDGRLYPIINGVVVMDPVAPKTQRLCSTFLDRNAPNLSTIKDIYNEELTRATLFPDDTDPTRQWHAGEMDFWETKFELAQESGVIKYPGWNRTIPRQVILKRLPESIRESIILEIGCGASHTLYDTWQNRIPNYIGLDLSFYACLLTRKVFPHGLFVQASVDNPPFRRECIDTIIAYGVFHHLPGHEENIPRLLNLVRQGGHIIGADPLLKPKIPRIRLPRRKNIPTGESPHNEWIDWQNLLILLNTKADIAEEYREYSQFRHLMVKLFYNKLNITDIRTTKIIIALDKLWLATVGKCHKSLAPSAIHYAIRKR